MRPLTFPFAFAALSLAALPSVSSAAQTLDYNRDIRPILSENCFSCHGPDEKGRKGKRRLDVAEAAYADRDGTIAIKPGSLEQSDAWLRITSEFEDELMPPKDSHLALKPEQKAKIKAWIAQGAPYAPHWAFVAPKKAPLASLSQSLAPSVPHSPIDTFVRAQLATEKLSPAPAADPRTLIRRVTLDLTGLPPSAAEVEAFVADKSPDAYQRLVSRLLASPAFGERMALDWLDSARYADTNGYSIDGGRHMWLWRDWVIQAFNDNKPYDRFLVEQFAGDLLPNRTDADLIATGFQRNNMVTHEGGTIPEENLTNYNIDRVKTLGESVLGLTLGCAQCHDHKFDPISQKDYFQVYAFFNTLGDKGLDGNAGINPGPFIEAATVLQTDEPPKLRAEIAALKKSLETRDDRILSAWAARERATLARRGRDFGLHEARVIKVTTPNRGAGFDLADGNRVKVADIGDLAALDVLMELPPVDQPITGLRAVFFPQEDLPGGGWGRGPRTRVAPKAKGKAAMPNAGQPEKGSFRLTALALSSSPIPGDQIDLNKLQPIISVTASSWDPQHLPAHSLDPRNESGWSPDLASTGPQHFTATLVEPFSAKENRFATVQLNFGFGRGLLPGLFQIYFITGTDDGTDLPADIVAALAVPDAERTPEATARLWAYCAQDADELRPQRVALANLEDRLAALTKKYSTMVMNVAPKPRDTFILNRGDYAQPTQEKVVAGTPSALPPMPEGAPADRFGLAQWLVQPDHPLTARVAVNRIWRLFFEQGLVATAADFGMQGENPSHPELLDWLAVDFIESGWDVKKLVTRIVTSDTYRQASTTTAAQLERDPQNRLLARGPRFRLQAEFVRDQALKVSGLLVPRIGGPSVNPYLPVDLWREVSHYGSTPATSQTFVQDHGEKLYRRSMYTYWKRTAPPPSMMAFDAPNREVCVVTRGNTTTPLQALVLLNDTQFVEASRAFAERILKQNGNDAVRLNWAFTEALAREPSAKELSVLTGTLARERKRYAANESAALQLLAVGESPRDKSLPLVEHAAWTQAATLLLNLSETVTRN